MLNYIVTNRKLILIILLTYLLHGISVKGQENLYIIDYYEALKIIEKNEINVIDTPVVAIIDKGINYNHEDLISNIWINQNEKNNNIDDDSNGFIDDIYGWNFADNTNDVSIGGIGNWHGTPVNGIIGADCNNNIGLAGICPAVKLMNIVKSDSIESIINSLYYVYKMRKLYNDTNGELGAFIVAVNGSWGKDTLFAINYPDWCDAYDSLGSVGVLCVSSVPDDNIDVDLEGDMPTTCESDYLITVTNSDQNDNKVYDSGYGEYSVDIAAPGENSYTTLNSGGYGYFNGTSAAAPYVTGVIGLLYLLPSNDFIQQTKNKPSKVASIIKMAIINGVDSLSDFENITTSGGRLNAFKSIKYLCDYYGEEIMYSNLFNSLEILSLYPNPASTYTKLKIESNVNITVTVKISNIKGQNVYIKKESIESGINVLSIDLTDIDKGFYIIQILNGKIIKSKKLLVL